MHPKPKGGGIFCTPLLDCQINFSTNQLIFKMFKDIALFSDSGLKVLIEPIQKVLRDPVPPNNESFMYNIDF